MKHFWGLLGRWNRQDIVEDKFLAEKDLWNTAGNQGNYIRKHTPAEKALSLVLF